MREIAVRSLYSKTILTLDAGWKEIKDNLDKLGYSDDEEITLDFAGITVRDTYRHFNFKDLFARKNIRFRFYNMGKEYEQLKVMAVMDGYTVDKVEHVEPKVVEKPEKKDLRIAQEVKKVKPHFTVSGHRATIVVKDIYRILGNSLSAKYIEEAAKEVLGENRSIQELMIDLRDVAVYPSVIDLFVEMKLSFERYYNVCVMFNTEDEKVIENMELYMHTKVKKKYSEDDKIAEINNIRKGTAGVLITYRKSRALDEFGRQGNGEVASARIALFNKLVTGVNSDGEKVAYAEFISFNGDTFYTREHWMLENDGEQLDELECNKVKIHINNLGIYDKFLGTKAHFARPIQESKDENIIMRSVVPDGKVVSNTYTLAERIKAVLDDFDIYYDKEELDMAIEETHMTLDNE